MPLRIVFCILVMLAPLCLGGCADTPSERGFKPFRALMRSDDQTLTKDEQKAAINELQADKTKQQQQTGQGATATPAKAVQ